MSQNHKNGQTTQTSNVKTARLLWVNHDCHWFFKSEPVNMEEVWPWHYVKVKIHIHFMTAVSALEFITIPNHIIIPKVVVEKIMGMIDLQNNNWIIWKMDSAKRRNRPPTGVDMILHFYHSDTKFTDWNFIDEISRSLAPERCCEWDITSGP